MAGTPNKMPSSTMRLTTGERVRGPPVHYVTRLAYALSLATSDEGTEGVQEAQPHLPKRGNTSTPSKAQRPWPLPVREALDPKQEFQSDASRTAEQAEEDSCAAAADWLGPTRCVNCDFAVDPYDGSGRFCCRACSISRGALHGSRCRRVIAAALPQTTEAQTDSQLCEAATARSLDAEAQTEAQQLPPTADTCRGASAQTEDDSYADTVSDAESSSEPTRPVPQPRRTVRPGTWWYIEEGQNYLILDFLERRIAIPAMPRVAGNDAWHIWTTETL